MDMKNPRDEFLGPVRLGREGQLTIPREVREMFGIKPGDKLLLLANKKKGIALRRGAL